MFLCNAIYRYTRMRQLYGAIAAIQLYHVNTYARTRTICTLVHFSRLIFVKGDPDTCKVPKALEISFVEHINKYE